jgi:hypothetical protein
MGRDPYAGATSPCLPSSAGPPSTAACNSGLQTDLATLAETIAQATSIIQAAGLTRGNVSSKSIDHLASLYPAGVKESTSEVAFCFLPMT